MAIPVWEVLLKHSRVNLLEDVQQKRDVENVSGVSQVFASHRFSMQRVNKCYLLILLSIYLLSCTAFILAYTSFHPNWLDFYWHIIFILNYHPFKCMGGI